MSARVAYQELSAYQEIPADKAGEAERRLAGRVLARCARDLGLGDVRLRWVLSDWWSETGVRGFVARDAPGCVFLASGMVQADLVTAVAHEARHLHQAARCASWDAWWRQRTPAHRAAQEADATAFAERFARDLAW